MSAERDALEAAQARIRALESGAAVDLSLLAEALRDEAERYQAVLEKGERKALSRENPGTAGRLMSFGFALLFVAPLVAMVGVSSAQFIRYQQEGAVLLVVLGVLLISGTFSRRVRRGVAHLFSPEWRLVRRAQRLAARSSTR